MTACLSILTVSFAAHNGWRCASSPARTRSPGPRRHSRNFKRRPAALHHKPSRRLRQVGTCLTAIRGGWVKRQSATDEQGKKSACARSVRSSGARRGLAGRQRANRDAPHPAPSADHGSCEWGASAVRRLPGLHVPRWRDVLQPDKREPLGPQMPNVRRSDRAGGRWSPLRPFSAKERAPRGRTESMNEFTTSIC